MSALFFGILALAALFFGIFAFAVAVGIWRQGATKRRMKRLKRTVFPTAISRRLKEIYPHLDDAQIATVMRGLHEFFAITLMAKGRMISMPSRAVDAAWHEFIVFTRGYQIFCRNVFGNFLHHTPAEAMRTPNLAQDGIKRAWRLSCLRENIDPSAPDRLPLLFAIDAMLAIPDGYKYALNCRPGSNEYCASDIRCGSGSDGSSGSSFHDHGESGGSDAGGDGGSGGD